MSTNYYHSLKEVHSGSYNWNIKVRIIRLWRGISRNGEEFKGLNILLLDDKNTRMHAFVSGNIIGKHDENLILGQICSISNLSVKDYKPEEKFRCVNSDKQIIFTNYTTTNKMLEDDMLIQKNMFDFYDLGDLADIANINVYLTDVIGVIEKIFPLRNMKTKFSNQQFQIKFSIVDGRCGINVTFWDSLAKEFADAIEQVKEYPPIVIIASAKITSWQGTNHSTPQIEISNASATKFYLNYEHHNVAHLRKMISSPLFEKYDFSSQIPEQIESLCIHEILNLKSDYVGKEVICKVKIRVLNLYQKWYSYACTSCYKVIESVDGVLSCYRCNREVPWPQRNFEVNVQGSDKTGKIGLLLFDREIRTLIGKTVYDLKDEDNKDENLPEIFKILDMQEFIVKVIIQKGNVENTLSFYNVCDMYPTNGKLASTNIEELTENYQESITQESQSSYHLDDFSQISVKTPQLTKKSKGKKIMK